MLAEGASRRYSGRVPSEVVATRGCAGPAGPVEGDRAVETRATGTAATCRPLGTGRPVHRRIGLQPAGCTRSQVLAATRRPPQRKLSPPRAKTRTLSRLP